MMKNGRDDADPAIVVSDLRVVRGGRVALRDVSLSVERGIVTGLLGPSGGGKSTLMRAIVGVQVTTSGSVQVLGEPAGSGGLRERVGYMTQAPSVYADLTVLENLRYFAAVLGAPASDAERVVEQVALTDHADALVGRLSGGQEARVSLAVALLGSPELLVLDEPTVGLDPVLRRELWEMFNRLADDGVTLLISSHVMDEAARCQHLVLLREGQVLAADEPSAILSQTDSVDIEQAFLRLVDSAGGSTENQVVSA
jgi:ABC-2 type transport system ATP-binding protein